MDEHIVFQLTETFTKSDNAPESFVLVVGLPPHLQTTSHLLEGVLPGLQRGYGRFSLATWMFAEATPDFVRENMSDASLPGLRRARLLIRVVFA